MKLCFALCRTYLVIVVICTLEILCSFIYALFMGSFCTLSWDVATFARVLAITLHTCLTHLSPPILAMQLIVGQTFSFVNFAAEGVIEKIEQGSRLDHREDDDDPAHLKDDKSQSHLKEVIRDSYVIGVS